MEAREIHRWLAAATLSMAAVLSGCGGHVDSGSTGDTGGSTTTTTGTSTTANSTGTTTSTSTGAIALALSSANISSGSTATVTATLTGSTGAPVPGVVVTFTTDSSYGVLTPSLGTALTDNSGNATVTLAAANLNSSGASTITATAQLGTNVFTVTRGYTVGAANVAVSTPTFGVNPLSAFGSTSVSVTVTSNAVPIANQLVTFSSPCASSGRAQLSASALTSAAGVATASYQDSGCGAVDRITAAASGLASNAADLTVQSPAVGSIQYVGATPSYITLKGSGGSGRQETSVVKFRVVDAASNPLGGRTVSFALSTTAGGIALSTNSAVSDSVTGEVQVLVSSGTVPTSVRVSASTPGSGGTTLTTMSDQLTVSVGLPDQNSMSLSATTLNIEGLKYDGIETVLTVRLGDVAQNPVPDGTAVNIIAEGARVGTVDGVVTGSCQTVNSTCSVVLTSQNPRPADGRVTVTAYAIGEESFNDLNGNGRADTGEFVNVGEAFQDDDEDGIRDAGERFVDFNLNGAYDNAAVDPLYSGAMCATSCSTRTSTHVWTDLVIVLSDSEAKVTVTPLAGTDLGGIPGRGTSIPFLLQVEDKNGNEMPAGTRIVVSSTNGSVVGGSKTARNTNGRVTGPQFFFEVKNDATSSEDPTPSGALTVTVTTPKGDETIVRSFVITN